MLFDGKSDLKYDRRIINLRKELNHDRGEFTFDPDSFREESINFKVEAYRLP